MPESSESWQALLLLPGLQLTGASQHLTWVASVGFRERGREGYDGLSNPTLLGLAAEAGSHLLHAR